jgi:transposase
VLRALLKKTYMDYEGETRGDVRLCKIFGVDRLPAKSVLHRAMQHFTLGFWRQVLKALVKEYVTKGMWLVVDGTGLATRASSVWYCLRIGRKIRKRDCQKLHLLQLAQWGLFIDFCISKGTRHDGPFLRRMLRPLRNIGMVFADAAYASKKTLEMIVERKAAPFIAFKGNASSSGTDTWAKQVRLATGIWQCLWTNIFHRRNLVESAFSALKRRYGSALRAHSFSMRSREIALRLIAHNVRQVLYLKYAHDHNLPVWVRA